MPLPPSIPAAVGFLHAGVGFFAGSLVVYFMMRCSTNRRIAKLLGRLAPNWCEAQGCKHSLVPCDDESDKMVANSGEGPNPLVALVELVRNTLAPQSHRVSSLPEMTEIEREADSLQRIRMAAADLVAQAELAHNAPAPQSHRAPRLPRKKGTQRRGAG